MEKFLKYNFTGAQPYNQSTYVRPVENCNGFKATNTGAVIVRVNDEILYPGTPGTVIGDSITFGGNLGEVYKGIIKITFDAGAGAEVTINQKQYILDQY